MTAKPDEYTAADALRELMEAWNTAEAWVRERYPSMTARQRGRVTRAIIENQLGMESGMKGGRS